jgi:hypothetical protein
METYRKLMNHLGEPTLIEIKRNGKINKATWTNKNGLDGIEYHFTKRYKWHPYPAHVNIYAYKYLNVPEDLIGPLKYASETIKIDEIDIPLKYSKMYHKTGKKMRAKVSGSCASVLISAMTIKFIEDMIKQYKNVKLESQNFKSLYSIFRNEYDARIKHYINTNEVKPPILWLKNKNI